MHEELRGIGCEVHADDGGAQYRVSAVGGHFGGSMDGVIRGLPEAPKAWHVLEVKTHSAKSFADLEKKGVRGAKPMHWTQMQAYMDLVGIDRALYYAVNKDTDAIYTERVEHDKVEAALIVARAERIVRASEPPPRISNDPAWFECKWCRFKDQCHGTAAPEVNCRTCAHATPALDREGGTWTCNCGTPKPLVTLPVHHQRVGCEQHRYIPVLLQRIGEPVDSDGDSVTYQTPAGARFVNGPAPGFASAEIRAAQDKGSLTDPLIQKLKAELPTARLKR